MYEITVNRTITRTAMVGNEWRQIKGDEYGYTPMIEKEITDEVEIYTQVVEDLDLVAVISAVNTPRPGPVIIRMEDK